MAAKIAFKETISTDFVAFLGEKFHFTLFYSYLHSIKSTN